jgi:hypothetical protein
MFIPPLYFSVVYIAFAVFLQIDFEEYVLSQDQLTTLDLISLYISHSFLINASDEVALGGDNKADPWWLT